MRVVALWLLTAAPVMSEDLFGRWKVNPARSTALYPGALIVRIEPHARGEVFTVDRVERDGRATTASTILYFDGKPRAFQEPACSGTQSSRRIDSQTVEILRYCGTGDWTRFVRRSFDRAGILLEITEYHQDGSRLQRRLVLEKE